MAYRVIRRQSAVISSNLASTVFHNFKLNYLKLSQTESAESKMKILLKLSKLKRRGFETHSDDHGCWSWRFKYLYRGE